MAEPAEENASHGADALDAGLSADAREHLRRAAEYYRDRDYEKAELELARMAHYAPDWPALDFNRGAVAEAQGNLDGAVEAYEAYLPHADERQHEALELRIAELERRRDQSRRVVRRQLAIGYSVLTLGLTTLGGGIAMLVLSRDTGRDNPLTGGGIVLVIAGVSVTSPGIALVATAHQNRRKLRRFAFTPSGGRDTIGATVAGRF